MKVLYLSKRLISILWIFVVILLVLFFLSQGKDDSNFTMYTKPLDNLVVVIDPGHGGFDSGAVSPSGTREDELNLKVAQRLEKLLNDNGAKAIMTRTDDNALASNKADDMKKRIEIIKHSNSDLVISIHMNKFGQSKYYGAQTFYMSGSTEGERLAKSIQVQLRENLIEGNNRQIKAVNNLLILKAGSAPTVVVECGFLSNPREEELLQESDYQDKIAWSIYNGIIVYITNS